MDEELKLNEPNEEQKLAIDHSGGVLLSAGAGSGKTFVLVEHIIHLFDSFYQKHKGLGEDEFSKELKTHFSEVVLMTFTKKAAGELALRLQSRFQKAKKRAEAGLEDIPRQYWELGEAAIPYMFVGTIHGFCYRLISQGYIPQFTGSEEMIGEMELRDKIEKLLNLWFELHFDSIKTKGLGFLIVNKRSIKNNLYDIFSDTDLRILWSRYGDHDYSIERDYSLIEKIISIKCGRPLEEFSFNTASIDPKELSKKWAEFLTGFQDNVPMDLGPLEFLKASQKHIESFKRMPSVSKKTASDELIAWFEAAKALKALNESYLNDLLMIQEESEAYQNWGQVLYGIYEFIETNYFRFPGLTFTDLEFFVWNAVSRKEEVSNLIAENFKYFIIDEFQDTSRVQFEIVSKLVKGDMGKVFSVGDVKQAIYGFRGGELGVFQEASESTYQNLSLKNNYRSESQIIKFNNNFFRFLLPKGSEYKGLDPLSVEMMEQNVPEFREKGGRIKKHIVSVETRDPDAKIKKNIAEMDFIEAQEIFSFLETQYKDEKETCLLYRKLSPTKHLIPLLLESELSFTCQVKISYEEDPIVCLFTELTRACAFQENRKEVHKSEVLISKILEVLGLKGVDVGTLLSEALQYHRSLGLAATFDRLLWSLNFSSSHTDHNFPLVDAIILAGKDKAEEVYECIKPMARGEYSLNFQAGDKPELINIMTTHASKGLEFSCIVLAGIHTNGIEKGDRGSFGKLPFSYKWFSGHKKSDRHDSPAFIYEKELKKRKGFSESKRLFYVACTRAVEELVWFDIQFQGAPVHYGGNSWVNAIRSWEDDCDKDSEESFLDIKEAVSKVERFYEDYGFEEKRLDLSVPMFQKNNLGILFHKDREGTSPLGIGAELSVTRLASITQCPRKFFLKNILKMEDDFKDENLQKSEVVESDEEEAFAPVAPSSQERGILIHEMIDHGIKKNFTLPLSSDLSQKDEDSVNWALSEVKKLSQKGLELLSEEPVKFSLFNQMISGTPDLVITDREEHLEIWDYKTGKISPEKLGPYWFQLKTYFYAYAQLLGWRASGEPRKGFLKLVFVDEKKVIEENIDIDSVENELFGYWSQLSNPDKINQEHCKFCGFERLCFPSS